MGQRRADAVSVPEKSRRQYAAGRRVKAPKTVRTLRDMIRKHLYDSRVTQGSLSAAWHCKPETVKTIMARRKARPMSSQYIDAFVEFLKLDDFDATELHRQGAREAGYKIDGPMLDDTVAKPPTRRKK